jgi:cyclopropane-fatty-acyl-phospholipid synthase
VAQPADGWALLRLEHSHTRYRVDFACYAAAITGLALSLLLAAPSGRGRALGLWVVAGGGAWSLVEYLLHRHVLHALPPFRHWHALHHQRPTALIASPTVLSASLFALGAAAPAWWLLGPWPACALMTGLLGGYLLYGLTHHALHHPVRLPGPARAWLSGRRRLHARHHLAQGANRGPYGVTQGWWDALFGWAAAKLRG